MTAAALAVSSALAALVAALLFAIRARDAERAHDDAVRSRDLALRRARGEPDLYLWTQRPGAGNHYLDATSGALCMAAWYRLLDDVDVFDAAGTAATETAARLRLRRVAPAGPRPDADPDTPTAPLVTRHSSLVTYPTPPPRRAPLVRVRSARMA